jgi:hypothetical protein
MIDTDAGPIRRSLYAKLLFGVLATVLGVVLTTPRASFAADDERDGGVVRRTVECGGFHLVRVNAPANLSEVFTTNISVRNRNPHESVSIERITIHDIFGNPVFDAGAAAGSEIPLNTDLTPPLDVTVVPPDASYYLSTKHIWGLLPLPTGNQNGFNLSLRIQYSTSGRSDLVAVVGSNVVRQRVQVGPSAFIEGDEHTRVRQECQRLK